MHCGPRPKQRKSGCSCPWNAYQGCSWVVVVVLVGLTYAFFLPNLPQDVYLGVTSAYTAVVILSAAGWVVTTAIDPSDPGVKYAVSPSKNPVKFSPEKYPNMCLLCNARVQAVSKHCQTCNRCTLDYDHHCVWLNTCIGSANYPWFLLLIHSLEVLMSLQLFTTLYLLLQIVLKGINSSQLARKYDFGEHGYCFVTLVTFVATVSFLALVWNGVLVLFHVYLVITKQNTHSFFHIKRKTGKVAPETAYIAKKPLKAVVNSVGHTESVTCRTPKSSVLGNNDRTAVDTSQLQGCD